MTNHAGVLRTTASPYTDEVGEIFLDRDRCARSAEPTVTEQVHIDRRRRRRRHPSLAVRRRDVLAHCIRVEHRRRQLAVGRRAKAADRRIVKAVRAIRPRAGSNEGGIGRQFVFRAAAALRCLVPGAYRNARTVRRSG